MVQTVFAADLVPKIIVIPNRFLVVLSSDDVNITAAGAVDRE